MKNLQITVQEICSLKDTMYLYNVTWQIYTTYKGVVSGHGFMCFISQTTLFFCLFVFNKHDSTAVLCSFPDKINFITTKT